MSKLIKESKIQRVKLRVLDPTTGEYKNSRRTTRCQITTFTDKDKSEVVKTEYMLFPHTFVTLEQIVLDWDKGPTPTPKPLYKYSTEDLIAMGKSDVKVRSYTSNQIELVVKRIKDVKNRREAITLIEKYNGKVGTIPGYNVEITKKAPKDSIKEAIKTQGNHKTTFKSNRNQQRKADSTGNLGNKRRY